MFLKSVPNLELDFPLGQKLFILTETMTYPRANWGKMCELADKQDAINLDHSLDCRERRDP